MADGEAAVDALRAERRRGRLLRFGLNLTGDSSACCPIGVVRRSYPFASASFCRSSSVAVFRDERKMVNESLKEDWAGSSAKASHFLFLNKTWKLKEKRKGEAGVVLGLSIVYNLLMSLTSLARPSERGRKSNRPNPQ